MEIEKNNPNELLKESQEYERKKKREEEYSFLDNDEIIYDNLNQGLHNRFWYFGKIFRDKENKEKEGIVVSSKDIFLNTSKIIKAKGETIELGENKIKQFGLNYLHSLEVNNNFWSNKSIKNWINSTEKIIKKEAYQKIRETIVYYMDVDDERIYDVATCWVIATYCYEMFESFGYLYFHALKESGKSKFKKILRLIGFNGQEASSISEASFFRTIENTKGVLAIDEYERMDTDRKKSTDLLLNAGIEKGASVKRVDKVGDKQVNRQFDVYCPKILCNITGLDPVTQSRCITIKLRKTANEKGKRKPKISDHKWQELRDICYTLIMDYWEEIKAIYDDYSSNLANRNEDIWTATLVLAKFFEVEESVREYAQVNIEETQIESIENDRTYLILKELLDCQSISDEVKELHLSDLMPYLTDKIDFGDKNPERVVGWHLTSLNIFNKGRDNRGITYSLNRGLVLMALISRGYPIPEKYQEYAKQLHQNTQTTLTSTTTQTTLNNDVSEISVVNVVKNKEDISNGN